MRAARRLVTLGALGYATGALVGRLLHRHNLRLIMRE